MDTFFAPNDWRYAAIGLSAILIDMYVLRRMLPIRLWCQLRLPSTFLHELAHFVAAFLLLGSARIVNLAPKPQADGSIQLGYTEWRNVKLGGLGQAIVAGAPFVWFWVGIISARYALSQPHDLLPGLGWLALCMTVVAAGMRPSMDDSKAMGWFHGTVAVLFLLMLIPMVLLQVPGTICAWFPTVCAAWR